MSSSFPNLVKHIAFLQERSDQLSRTFEEWQRQRGGEYESLSVQDQGKDQAMVKWGMLSNQPVPMVSK